MSAPLSAPSSHRLTLATLVLLLIPPLMWAGNAVVGRLMQGVVPPVTLNFLRWVLALLMLLPVAGWVLRPGSGLWPQWRRFALLGLLGVGMYNTLQYMALKTSTPINVTLVASSIPVWMLIMGRVFYGVPISHRAAVGAFMSLCGVVVVIARGDLAGLLSVQLVPGDLLVLLAALAWAWYSWMLARPPANEPTAIKAHWAAFLLAQIVFGLIWSVAFTAAEWLTLPALPAGESAIQWGWPLVAGLVFVAVGPSLLAYRSWGAAVARVGPATAAIFSNLTPLFAALLSAILLREPPQLYHLAGFVLIVGGILVSSRR